MHPCRLPCRIADRLSGLNTNLWPGNLGILALLFADHGAHSGITVVALPAWLGPSTEPIRIAMTMPRAVLNFEVILLNHG
jgi:hypothetical protein